MLGIVAVTALSGCSTRAEPDEIILYYKAGVGDNREFVECIAPSTAGKYPIDDVTYSLPTNLRTWNIIEDGSGDTTDPLKSGTLPVEGGSGSEVLIYATAEFVINTNCDGGKNSPIVNFWETVGRRYDAHTPEGWLRLVKNTVVPAEKAAFRSVTREYNADDLIYNTDGVWTEVNEKVAKLFVSELSAKTGGRSDFFCNPAFNRDTVDCPPISISIIGISDANAANQAARDNVRAVAEKAKADLIEAESKVAVARATAEATRLNKDYIELQKLEYQLKLEQERTKQAEKCAASPNCTLVVGGNGNVITSSK